MGVSAHSPPRGPGLRNHIDFFSNHEQETMSVRPSPATSMGMLAKSQ